jgi:hypothetical protein
MSGVLKLLIVFFFQQFPVQSIIGAQFIFLFSILRLITACAL